MQVVLSFLFAFHLLKGIDGYAPFLLHPHSTALIKLNEYDSSVRPPGVDNRDDPVNVSVNLILRSVEKIDHTKNEFKIQITFREEWDDQRLAYAKDYSHEVTTNEVQFFWRPDIFFSNEKSGQFHVVTKPNSFVRLSPTGRILLSSRISLTLQCDMNLWNFPFDTQTCGLRLPSYGYTTDDVILQWKDGDRSVESFSNLLIPGYQLINVAVGTCHSTTSTGDYSCLKADLRFKRDTFPYVIRFYIPITVLVLASWTSFWLPASAAIHRLTIGSTTSIITALLIFREEEFLRLPSLTALDVWVGISALYVFSALFEFILLTLKMEKQKQLGMNNDPEAADQKKGGKILWFDAPVGVPVIDAISRIAYPTTYALFHVVFGPMLF